MWMGEMASIAQPDRADQTLEVCVLGEFAVRRDGKDVGLPPSRKTRALLAYLAVVGRPQRRERLCQMFWARPDDPRGALRWSLSKIRQIVNDDGRDALVADRNSVTLRSTSIAVDFRRVTSLADMASLDLDELEGIAHAFRGRFLEDLSLPNCPEFEAWRISHVDEADLVRAGILRTLIERLEPDASRALPHAHALLAMHPEDDSLAAVVKILSERARAQAVALPTAPMAEGGHTIPPPRAVPMSSQSSAADTRALDTQAERRHVTVLSVDIVSPLDAFASVDPEVIVRQLGPLIESTFGIVELHGGIVSASGDSRVTAVFGALPGSGHHAVSACRAALVVKSTIEKQSEGSVRVRAGLDTGEVIIQRRRRGGTERIEVTGAAARTALRLTQSLRRGVLAATDRTRSAVAGLVDMIPLARSDVPRFDRDEQAYELQGVSDSEVRI
jgi:DNA-binding SARP family transcriptional activator/class 3 adenylate cyclase